METYQLKVANQVYLSLVDLIEYRKAFNATYAEKFSDGFLDTLKKLTTLPHRGINLRNGFKGLIYEGCIIVYTTDPSSHSVLIVDIIDPRQHTKSGQYL